MRYIDSSPIDGRTFRVPTWLLNRTGCRDRVQNIHTYKSTVARWEYRFAFIMSTKLLLCFVGLLLSLGLCRADELGGHHAPFWAGKLWAQYSPYAPAGSYKSPPRGCSIKQVNLVSDNFRLLYRLPGSLTIRLQLQRHGARYPTTSARKNYLTSLAKLKSAPHYDNPQLNFLKNYTVVLGVDDLISFGATE